MKLSEKIQSGLEENNKEDLSGLNEKYKEILENSMKLPQEIQHNQINNVLLTGATGYLGMHILEEFLKKEKGKMYIFEHNPWNFLTNKLVNECPFDEDAELISSIKLCHYLKNVNARKIKTKYIVFFPRKGIFFGRPLKCFAL